MMLMFAMLIILGVFIHYILRFLKGNVWVNINVIRQYVAHESMIEYDYIG